MKMFVVAAGVACLWTPLLAQEATHEQESKTPLMVSFTDLKWVELPERKGMQFAVLSGDPKSGEYTQIRKVPAGTDNPLHSHSSELKNVIISGIWYTGADAASATITAETADEVQPLLIAAFGDWVDFLFTPSPKPFVIYADHDEYATFFASSRSHLNSVATALVDGGFKSVENYIRKV